MRLPVIRSMAAALLGLALSACEPATDSDDDTGLLDGVEIDLLEAMVIAAQAEPDGITLDAELSDEEGDGPQYDIDRQVDGETLEIVIDARTGSVVRVRTDPEDQVDGVEQAEALQNSAGQITLAVAVENAMAAAPGQAVSAELDLDEAWIEVVLIEGEERRLIAIDLDDGSVRLDSVPVGGD